MFVPEREWVRTFWENLDRHGLSDTYVNALTDTPDDRVRSAYGPEKYARLAQLKSIYGTRTTSSTETPTSSRRKTAQGLVGHITRCAVPSGPGSRAGGASPGR